MTGGENLENGSRRFEASNRLKILTPRRLLQSTLNMNATMNSPTHNTTVPLGRSCATIVNTNGLTVTAPSPPPPSAPASKKLKTPTKYLPSDVLEELMVFLGIAECCAIQATSIDFHKAIDFRLEKHCDPVVVSFLVLVRRFIPGFIRQIVFLGGVDRSLST